MDQPGCFGLRGLWLVMLFDLGASTSSISGEMGVACRMAYKALTYVRLAILVRASETERLLDGAVEMGEAYFGGRWHFAPDLSPLHLFFKATPRLALCSH